ncbi:E3 UFM1-protein ligase 1 isoform X2 [Oopsacas minuta]|uniref:E3 UFM1-protein ligase 1 isoform X2 n=1 Tax=Oopsacas minuta TaxID=111878 RepID=A0AAV7KEL7_9METZ|nr:E3 UFM1-protein ligase 1 isoform X2 [Oopsacas minuta]
MATNEWTDVHALQDMLHQVQNAPEPPRLSEQNCVEIIQKIIKLNLIELIHTLDGKEYLTHEQLFKEIREETLAQGGRVSLLSLQTNLNVDIGYIQKFTSDLSKQDNQWLIIQGDFINRRYLDKWSEELNDNLQEAGILSITDICTHHNFTKDFVLNQIQQRLGHSIQGHIEHHNADVVFTDGYLERQKSSIRGILNATTQPLKVQTILKRTMKEEKLFHSILTQLLTSGEIKGTIRGSLDKELFIPNFYIEAQEKWIDSSIQANGYTDYERLLKSGIPDPISYVQKNYDTITYFQLRKQFGKNAVQLDVENFKLILLDSCCISNQLLSQIEANIENTLTSGEWVDIVSIAPPVFNQQDCIMLLQLIASQISNNVQFKLFSETAVVSELFLENLPSKFDDVIEAKVQRITASCSYLNELFQVLTGRVSKFKVVYSASKPKKGKGKGKRKVHEQEDELSNQYVYPELEFMNSIEISRYLPRYIQEISPDFREELAAYLEQPLTSHFHSMLLDSIKSKTKGQLSSTDIYNQLTMCWYHLAIFKQAIDEAIGIPGEIFTRYLLSSICSEITNLLLYLLIKDFCNEPINDPKTFTEAKRMKLISLLNEKQKPLMVQLSKSLHGKEIDIFFLTMDKIFEHKAFSIKLDYPNTKKRKSIISGLIDTFEEQLKEEKDFATILHLATVISYTKVTGLVLHSPGKGVPHILDFLANNIPEEKIRVLKKCQSLIIKKMIHMRENDKWDNVQDFEQETQRLNQELIVSTEEVISMIFWH